ncbi:MAG TPA: carboxypeptidase regulatory-like domain-containing protein [Candidatus Acidoferrales bacterium]|nr:carboxypeptidase regulatory-like domain-containing protein [Candidatus Acidoferrales bacterium]
MVKRTKEVAVVYALSERSGEPFGCHTRRRLTLCVVFVGCFLFLCAQAWAATGGSISGRVKDPSEAVIPGASLTLVNLDITTSYKTKTDAQGFYSFPNLPVGRYELTIEAAGFKTQKKTGLVVDADAAVRVDLSLDVGERNETVTVSAVANQAQAQVETVATHLGEVVQEAQIIALPLNGRSYTDLLAIQPGVSPVTTLTPTSVIMSGVTGTINPSGDLNPGDVSINGQRESANGFMVNGTDVQEHMNGGTSVIPNLDSIQEFRLLTTNFDPEYGNYNGGMVNVVTKSGSDSFHGNGFEFLRNTALDAKNFFADTRGVFRQNQFGGTVGGPIKRQKLFFFADYQGTRTEQGVTSPLISVPSLADRNGNLSDAENSLTGHVSGPALADLLTTKLGYAVSQGEPYFAPGCSSATCVLPGAQIPMSAWSTPAMNLLQYIPKPDQPGDLFSTSAFGETVRDDKAAGRVDANTRWGQFSGYYFIDSYRLDNPYPGGQGGASVPGFDALTIGRAQLFTLGYTRVLGGNTVNEFHGGLIRNANDIGEPHGGLGASVQSQGFVTSTGAPGFTIQAPQFEGVENIVFPSFIMGVPITNVNQWNNTLYLSDSISKVAGSHTLKFGSQFHIDQVNEHPNATFNGTFSVLGTETGSAFADFLLGVPSNFTQSTGQPYHLRNRYAGAFVEDSWRVRSDLTLNLGVRWDLIMPWWEKNNNIQTIVPGRQSVLYPNALPDLLVPGDPGIPSTLSPSKYRNFAPRIGFAYSPRFDGGVLGKLFGGPGKSSVRASYGIFYTAFPGLSAGIMYSVPPFGYNYLSPAPPLFATPFVNAGDGVVNPNPYPITFPPNTVTAKNPYMAFNWAAVTPISADPYFYFRNGVPYTENYMFSFQRQITSSILLTMSYVGNEGHHILVLVPTNVGDAPLCLSLSQLSEVAPGSSTCGPYGEDGTYTSAAGHVSTGTRDIGLGSNYGATTAQRTIGNSNYNALETNLRYAGKRSTVLFAYTYAKSIDQASNIGEQLNPFNPRLSRAISSWDLRHNFVASYQYDLPFERLFGRTNQMTQGWSISGTTRFASGFPVTLFDDSDNSLLGTLGNGVNNNLLDTPEFTPGPLQINTNPRSRRPEFNTSLFSTEPLGQLGNSRRRFFYGPGIDNFDMQVTKNVRLTESKALDLRIEGFNVFNHAQFYGPGAVDGEVNDIQTFGTVVSAVDPRLIQVAAKFTF